jgi:hypothetical protein
VADYREVTGSIQVPANTGIEGFLHTLKTLLRKPRVQRVVIDARGKVSFTRYALSDESDEPANLGVDFSDLQPYYIIRNAAVRELLLPTEPAPVSIGRMFDRAASDHMRPIAFAVGADSQLWSWYALSTGHSVSARDQFFGLPVLPDRDIDDGVVFLCAGLGRDAAFIDTQLSYKISIPQDAFPATAVEVLP